MTESFIGKGTRSTVSLQGAPCEPRLESEELEPPQLAAGPLWRTSGVNLRVVCQLR